MKKEKENNLNEPHVPYSGGKKITFSDSFDAAEQEQIRYWASLTPAQRFSHYYELMNRFYTLSPPKWSGTKIIIDQ